MDGFCFTNASIIDDNLEKFSIEDVQAAMQKMQGAFEKQRLGFDDFSLFGPRRKYAEAKMRKPLVDTGEIRHMFRPRFAVQICNPDVLREIISELHRIFDDPPVDTSDDTQLDCWAEQDTEIEG
jgi:hypothetical protein